MKLRHEQVLEEFAKGLLLHAAWGGGHPQLEGGTMHFKHILIGIGNGMMSLVNYEKPHIVGEFSPFVWDGISGCQLLGMTSQPLHGKHLDPTGVLRHPEALQETNHGVLRLFHQFTTMGYNPYIALVVTKEPLHDGSHHHSLACTRGHLHHHGIASRNALTLLVIKHPMLLFGKDSNDVCQHLLLVVVKFDS